MFTTLMSRKKGPLTLRRDSDTKDGSTWLHYAAIGGSVEIVEFLLNEGYSMLAKDNVHTVYQYISQ
jgi:hypothetical protein